MDGEVEVEPAVGKIDLNLVPLNIGNFYGTTWYKTVRPGGILPCYHPLLDHVHSLGRCVQGHSGKSGYNQF